MQFLSFFLAILLFFIYHLTKRVWCAILHKITVFSQRYLLALEQRSLSFTPYLQQPARIRDEDDKLGVSNGASKMKLRKESIKLPFTHSLPKLVRCI